MKKSYDIKTGTGCGVTGLKGRAKEKQMGWKGSASGIKKPPSH